MNNNEDDDATDIESDSSDNENNVPQRKKRKIDHELFDWDFILKRIENPTNKSPKNQIKLNSNKLSWIRICQKLLTINHNALSNSPDWFRSKLLKILYKIIEKNDNSNKHILDASLSLINQMSDENDDFNKLSIIKTCLDSNYQFDFIYKLSHNNLDLIDFVVKKFINSFKVNSNQDFSKYLSLISRYDLIFYLNSETKIELANIFIVDNLDPELRHFSKEYLNKAEILTKLSIKFTIKLKETESIEHIKFIFDGTHRDQNDQIEFYSELMSLKPHVKLDETENHQNNLVIPDKTLFNHIIQLAIKRSKKAIEHGNVTLQFDQFLFNLNIVFWLDALTNLNEDSISKNDLVKDLFAITQLVFNSVLSADIYQHTNDLIIAIFEDILFNFTLNKTKSSKIICNFILNSKLIEKCLQCIDLNEPESQLNDQNSGDIEAKLSTNIFLKNHTKADYLQLLCFNLLILASIEFYNNETNDQKCKEKGLNLKVKLFKYVNLNRQEFKHSFLISFLNCFLYKKSIYFMITVNEFEFCLQLFDYLFSSHDLKHNNLYLFVFSMDIFYTYSLKLLTLNSYLIHESKNAQSDNEQKKLLDMLRNAQDNYIRIAEKCSRKNDQIQEDSNLNNAYSSSHQLVLIKIQSKIIEIHRFRTRQSSNNKRAMISYFNKFLNNHLSIQSNASNKVKLEAIKQLVQSAFTSFKCLYSKYLYEYLNGEKSACYNDSESEETGENSQDIISDSDQNAFFDKFYSNLILNEKVFNANYDYDEAFFGANHSTTTTFQSSLSSNSLAEKYSNYKKTYACLKKNLNEPFFMQHLVVKFFELILNENFLSSYRQTYIIKCLFGLIQLSIEYPRYFEVNTVKVLINKFISNLNGYLINQWIDIYLPEVENQSSLSELIQEKFPLEIFGFESPDQFIKENMNKIVSHNCFASSSHPKCQMPEWVEKSLCKLNTKDKIRFYSSFLLSVYCRSGDENLAKQKIYQLGLIDLDYLKNNFYFVYESFLINNDDALNSRKIELLTQFTNFMLSFCESNQSQNKTKQLLALIDSNNPSFYIYQILSKIDNKILENETDDSHLIYWLNLKENFLEKILIEFGVFHQISGGKSQIPLIDSVCLSIINGLKITIKNSIRSTSIRKINTK